MTYHGACLCGSIQFDIHAELEELVFCHCGHCRKAQGVLFAANVPIPKTAFELRCGAELIAAYAASSRKSRYFCSRCGSPLYSHVEGADHYRIRAGCLDPSANPRPSAHIFATSKTDLHDIDDGLPQYPGREPGR